jgi:hypothetical protein
LLRLLDACALTAVAPTPASLALAVPAAAAIRAIVAITIAGDGNRLIDSLNIALPFRDGIAYDRMRSGARPCDGDGLITEIHLNDVTGRWRHA